jgi:hypothetical protein
MYGIIGINIVIMENMIDITNVISCTILFYTSLPDRYLRTITLCRFHSPAAGATQGYENLHRARYHSWLKDIVPIEFWNISYLECLIFLENKI